MVYSENSQYRFSDIQNDLILRLQSAWCAVKPKWWIFKWKLSKWKWDKIAQDTSVYHRSDKNVIAVILSPFSFQFFKLPEAMTSSKGGMNLEGKVVMVGQRVWQS